MRRYWIATLPVLALVACQETAGPTNGLTRAEALAVAARIVEDGETATNVSAGASTEASASAVPTTFSQTLQTTHPCPSGGKLQLDVEVSGSFETRTSSIEIEVDGTQTHDDCAFPYEGITLTLDGNPDIDFSAHAAIANSLPSEPFTASANGAFRYSTSDGRSGTCTLTLSSETDFAARETSFSGSVCGHSVSQVTRWN
jgi:hypothetical protein